MNKRQITIGLAGMALALVLTACGTAATQLPDMSVLGEVTAVAREEGSGTRTEFEKLIGTNEQGASRTVLSTQEMLDQVASDQNAIGYLAVSALQQEDRVKILAVDGILPEAKAIEKGRYPLCRNYVLAYTGELSAVEMDFVTYIRSAGQEIVAENCMPVAEPDTFLSDRSAGQIAIHGSSSVGPLMEQLVADYETYNPNAVITIRITDSTGGLNDAMRGDCDLAMSSRALKDYEAELLETETIATDGMAVIVNTVSPLEELSCDRIRSLYDGTVQKWKELK